MKLQVQTALAALILGMCSTVVLADGEEGAKGGDGGYHHPGRDGCGTKCDGKIDIELFVEKHCDLDIDKSKIVMQKNLVGGKWSGQSGFDVRANAPYSLNITKPSTLDNEIDASQKIPVNVDTKLGLFNYTGAVLPYTSSTRTFTVKAETVSAVSDMAHWGTYKGTYKVAVAF
ncbi:hypothetical protein ACUM6W_11630 [Acinetobacter tandoii]|jgi:hypothetical protein|uniref:Spore coat protein U domain-containing protein n=2 Tax=Acinetobacter tandoii TaxID=202954 RepID=R9B572_9GAMM|nr:hypothetical protein [Acinetobacter tandoii]EOR09410.1 hypothetical protein I593_01119 [Acinetobacter tandoii DSM 14970 = CIP 107469]KAB1854503.1 hypothetical protein F4W09_10410 [Acinetobacter tandoii]